MGNVSMWMVFLVLLAAVALFFVITPLFRSRRPWVTQTPEGALALLDKEKAKVLRELKDLELERESGAIEETEYQELRQSYLTDAALVNRRISALRRDAGPPVRGTDSESTGEAASPRKEIAETSEGRPS